MTEQAVLTQKTNRPAQARTQAPPAGISLTPKEALAIVQRHVLLIIVMTILGAIIAGGLWGVLRVYWPKYTSIAFIEVLNPGKSDPLVLNSQSPTKDILYTARLSKAMLIKQQSSLQELIGLDKVKDTDWFKSFRDDVKAVDDLKDNLVVSAERDSDFVTVSMTCSVARESALIANQMVDLFIARQVNETGSDSGEKLARLREQESNINKELTTIQTALDEIRTVSAASGITMVAPGSSDDPTRHTITLKLNELTIERDKLQTKIKEIESNIGTLEELAKGPLSVQVEHQVETDLIMLNLGERLSLLQSELARKLARFGENHKEIRTLRESIRQTREERNARQIAIGEMTRQANWKDAQDQLKFLTSQLAELERLRQEAEGKQKELDAQRAKYEALTVLRKERQDMLGAIKEQIEKTNILRTDPEAPKVRKAGMAPVPLEVSSPDWVYYFSGGPILGFLFGLALAFMIELLNDTVRTPSDVTRQLRSTLLGIIPNADEDDQAEGVDLCHIARKAPYSVSAECYRRIRTSIRLASNAESLKTMLVTSGSPGEGKTCMAVNLASTLAAEDKKVLFIDTNFRRPASQQIFADSAGSDQSLYGLSDILTGQVEFSQAIRSSGIENLDVIDCGSLPVNPTELLGGQRMRQLLEDLGKKYDHIVLDSAPVLLISDARLLASLVKSTILVLDATKTKRGAAIRTLHELTQSNANIVGCVLFSVRALKGGYFAEMFELYRKYQKTQLAHSI